MHPPYQQCVGRCSGRSGNVGRETSWDEPFRFASFLLFVGFFQTAQNLELSGKGRVHVALLDDVTHLTDKECDVLDDDSFAEVYRACRFCVHPMEQFFRFLFCITCLIHKFIDY